MSCLDIHLPLLGFICFFYFFRSWADYRGTVYWVCLKFSITLTPEFFLSFELHIYFELWSICWNNEFLKPKIELIIRITIMITADTTWYYAKYFTCCISFNPHCTIFDEHINYLQLWYKQLRFGVSIFEWEYLPFLTQQHKHRTCLKQQRTSGEGKGFRAVPPRSFSGMERLSAKLLRGSGCQPLVLRPIGDQQQELGSLGSSLPILALDNGEPWKAFAQNWDHYSPHTADFA